MRRDYESLYALGVAFTAYAAAEAVGGSGFLAAFAAGLVIAALDVELCDCFLDYGEASAEMFLLLTFVAFGAGLIWTGFSLAGDWRVLVFAAVALGVRTAGAAPGAGARRASTPRSRRLIALFGPRGPELAAAGAAAGVRRACPGAERLFTITCLVVLLSVVIHGGGIALYLRRHGGARTGAPRRRVEPRPASRRAPTRAVARGHAGASDAVRARLRPPQRAADAAAPVPEKITIQEFRDLHRSGEPVIVLDVRTERSYRDDPEHRRRRHPHAAGRRGPPGARATTRPARHARPLLCVKGRSHKRPGGARASSSGMEEGEGAGRRVGGVAGGGAAGRAEGEG